MDLIISPDFLKEYLSCINKQVKNELDKICFLIFNNQNNNFLLGKKLLEFYEECLEDTPGGQELLNALITEIIDNKLINCMGCNNDDVKILMGDMENHYLLEKSIQKSNCILNLSKNINQSINNFRSGVLDLIINNKNKLIIELAAYNPREITFRYHDFVDDNDIKEIFNCFFELSNNNSSVDIFDRQTNLNHTYFDPILNKSISYYTKTDSVNNEINENAIIKHKFPRSRIFRINRNNIHERKLKIGVLVLETDEDFHNIEVARSTWKISIVNCSKNAVSLERKKLLFVQDNK
jgi:hypothetical protein